VNSNNAVGENISVYNSATATALWGKISLYITQLHQQHCGGKYLCKYLSYSNSTVGENISVYNSPTTTDLWVRIFLPATQLQRDGENIYIYDSAAKDLG
jgi:hypothetical protein